MKLSQIFPIAATIVCSVTAQGSINGSATDPFILVGDGAGIDELFTTASQNGQNIAVLANENNPLLASNVFIDNESHLMVQPTNTTIFLPVELLNSGGPAKGINAVVVDAGSGTTGFFVSEANCDLFSNDPNFRTFVLCSAETVQGLPQLFWATAHSKTPRNCEEIQFLTASR